jgi:hypothetical protein
VVRQVLQTGLEVEMTDHLGYEPHATEGRGSGNSRNGRYPKTVTTDVGQVELRVPWDRNSTFAPVTVRTTTLSTHADGCGVTAKEARPRSRTTPRPATAMASAPTISVVDAT